jgi:hypothetical protein
MAKILFTAFMADARGKVNGSVFSKNKGGSYIRTKVTPVNPQTTAQQNSRNRIATFSQAWRGLTQTQRNSWINSAVNFPYTDIFGNIKYLSGSSLYVKLNVNLAITGTAAIDDAPSPVSLPAITALSVTAAAGTPAVSIVFAATPVPAGYSMVIEAAGNVGAGKSFVKNLYRQIAVRAAASTSPFNALTAYEAVFGAPVAGAKIFVRAFLISTDSGQAGIAVQADAIIAA